MKLLFSTLLTLLIVASCSSSKDYLSRVDEDNTLFEAVKMLRQHSADSSASKALPVLYAKAQERHLKKIKNYSGSTELSRWDKIIAAYTILQKMYDAISQSAAASELVTPANYQHVIYDLKQSAAEDYYQQATILMDRGDRAGAKEAYNYYKKAGKLVPGYKDASSKMNEAFQLAIVNVLINPVVDHSFSFNSSWGNYGYNYSNEYFQQTLVRELGGQNASRYPARFYTEWEANRDKIQPDIVINLSIRNMDFPRPAQQNYYRNSSNQVVIGRDSSGKDIYQTVYAQVNISKQSFTARIEMEVDITEVATRKNISTNIFSENYNWQQESASYTGDQRALSQNDWSLINNRQFNEPRKEEVLNELYRKLYPQIKNKISYAVDW